MKNVKNTKILIVLSIALLIAFSGCTEKNERTIDKTVSSPEGDIKISGKVGTGSDWCKSGTKITSTGPTGEQGSFEIKGIVNYEGKDVCSSEWSGSEGSMTQYFNEDNTYLVMIVKDKDGKEINKVDMSQPK